MNWYVFMCNVVVVVVVFGIEDSCWVVMVCMWVLLVGDDLGEDLDW